jgi:hypothetical protein
MRTGFTIRPHFDVCGGEPAVFTVVDRSYPVIAFKDAFTMKQSAAKTLGVAALGAAFAAVGAGAADAAPAVPDATQALDGITRTLPTDTVAKALPGAGEALTQGQAAVGAGLAAAQPAAQKVLAEGPTAPAAGLLGGLPVQGLPTHGLPVNGIPLG